MKKIALFVAALFISAITVSSCNKQACPAYSQADTVQSEQIA